MVKIKSKLLTHNYLVFILLSVHFLINIAIYFNTKTFYEISDTGAIFDAYDSLLKGEKILPISGYFFLTPAFIAFFINGLVGGGLYYYFIFQIILSSVTAYVVYRIILYITKSEKQAIISIIIMILYTEYDLLGSVFYNHVYEIFFMSLFLLLIFIINDEIKIKNLIIYTVLILLCIYLSLFFRRTLIFIFITFIFLLLLNIKNKNNFLKFSLLTVLSFLITFGFNPYKMYNSNYVDNSETLFWGHTLYGGHGGEASFLYPENENRYNERLREFLTNNNIDSITPDVIKRFQISEVTKFIKNEPHKWIFLQIRKVIYTFGSVPQRDGLLMLYNGKIKMPWLLSAMILQLPYSIIFLLFLLSMDLNFKNIIQDPYKRILYFIGIYLIFGICIFSAYQEKYRPVIFICFFIPIIAINFNKLIEIFNKENRRELFIKIIIILLILSAWIYQAYEALIIEHDRYFKVIQ
jgi:hypothetical protein